jgi:hypothetical protein
LTKSLGGLPVPLLKITNFDSQSDMGFYTTGLLKQKDNFFKEKRIASPHLKEKEMNKKIVFLTGRIHPGETNSSWIMHGLINFLIGPSQVARQLRDKCIFYLIPMMNTDGVIIGNQRTDLLGYDLN